MNHQISRHDTHSQINVHRTIYVHTLWLYRYTEATGWGVIEHLAALPSPAGRGQTSSPSSSVLQLKWGKGEPRGGGGGGAPPPPPPPPPPHQTKGQGLNFCTSEHNLECTCTIKYVLVAVQLCNFFPCDTAPKLMCTHSGIGMARFGTTSPMTPSITP